MGDDTRRVEYMPLDDIERAPRNPKQHAGADIGASLIKFGMAEMPLLDERTGRLVAGHGRLDQLAEMRRAGQAPPRYVRTDPTGRWLVPVQRGWASEDDATAEAYLLASNNLTTKGGWNRDELGEMLTDLNSIDPTLLDAAGFSDEDLEALLATPDEPNGGGGGGRYTDDDAIPQPAAEPVTRPGDLWHLGPHRLICADTTLPTTVERLFEGMDTAVMLHADPPYGLGKTEVLNDNLRREQLDAFQQCWWRAWRARWAANGSAYIWGNAPDLWRWWWRGGLGDDPDLMVQNEIVWDKADDAPGRGSPEMHCLTTATERCLLIFRGPQYLDSGSNETWWEGHEPLRAWMCTQRDAAGWTNKDLEAVTGTRMAQHWTNTSQFHVITQGQYDKLREAAAGRAFVPTYHELVNVIFPGIREQSSRARHGRQVELEQRRTWFDNAHDLMTDVWRYAKLTGQDRWGHATPKPVAMVERAITTCSRPGDVVGVPFGGTGPEWIAADHLGRIAVGAEVEPRWVDVICRRYQQHTGTTPQRERPDGSRELIDFS